MNITKNKSLLSYNTFHIEQSVETFIEIDDENELLELIKDKNIFSKPIYILGGGSNILLTKNIEGILLHNRLKGIEIIYEDDEHVFVKFHSGEIWHECVLWSIKQHLAGIENLSLIPGTIGAAPIQNIGAYGVELKDVFYQLEAIHLQSGNRKTFNRNECQFAYRNSLFKTTEYKNYFITHVVLKLNKTPKYKIDYGDIRKTIEADFHGEINIQNIAQAVINIRKSKLPDPAEIGNAGSFFKNPVINESHFLQLQNDYSSIPNYPAESGVKVPAAWLIEQCGWKGYRKNAFGVHPKQALVLVNYDNANGDEIWNLSQQIIDSVHHKFNIQLEREVNVW